MYVEWALRVFAVFFGAVALIVFSSGALESPPPESSQDADLSPPVEETESAEAAPGKSSEIISVGSPRSHRDLFSVLETAPDGAIVELHGDARDFRLSRGPVIIDRSLTIRAADGAPPISTEGLFGALLIKPGAGLLLDNVDFKNAAGPGAPAIENHGISMLRDVSITESFNKTGPAAISTTGTLLAAGLHLQRNESKSGPGAIRVAEGYGRLIDTTAFDNRGHRGGVVENDATLHIDDGYFASNRAAEGGAVSNRGQMNLENSAFWTNRGVGGDSFAGALLTEGRLHMTNTTFHANEATFGSAMLADGGLADLAHVTFFENPNRAGSDVFVGSSSHLRARNTIFSGGDAAPFSIDVVDGGTVESLGGNIVPRPAGLWPDDPLEIADWLGESAGPEDLPTKAPVGASGWIRVVPLDEGHPGRLAIPTPHCLDAHGQPLARDQSGNLRAPPFRCDAGAHQSAPETTTRPLADH